MTDQNSKIKIAIIIVLYKTPKEEIRRLKLEVRGLKLDSYRLYFIDNTNTNRGYATGVNKGIKQALIDDCQLFIVANPDISLKGNTAKDFLEGRKYLDIWGFAMKMHGKVYYGGEVDRWRLSGGLIKAKPKNRFVSRDFTSGSLMCIKKEVIEKIGFFDESYFMYYEDVDFCQRARKAGFQVGIDSRTIYNHFEISKNNPEKELALSQTRQKFFKKYGNIWQKIYELVRLPKTVFEKKSFIFNFASLNISSLVNKLLNFILFIFLVRFLKPEEYGIYALVWAQVSLFSPIVDLGTTAYGIVNLPREKKNRFVSLFNLRLAVSIAIFFLTIIVGSMMFKSNPRVIGYIFLTSFVIFSNMLSGGYLIKNAIEGKIYNSSLVSNVFNVLLIIALCVSTVIFRSLPVIFILIFVFYNLYSLANYFLIHKGFKKFSFTVDMGAWKSFMRKSYVYVLIGFLSGIYFKIDVFLLQSLKGEAEVGIYSAGYKFFEAFLFIAASYNVTRTPRFALLVKKGTQILVETMKKDIIFLATIGFVIAFFSYFIAPLILPIFLKGNYTSSIAVVRLVMFALPFILISSVFLNAIYVLKSAKIIIAVFLFQAVINFILNFLFIPQYSYIASSYITVISEILNFAILLVIFQFIIKKYNENIT